MKFLIVYVFMSFLSFAYAENFEQDDRTKANIQKELDGLYHMNFKAILCPIADIGATGGGFIPIPQLPGKFGGGEYRKPKCDGAEEFGVVRIKVKGFFNLRFSYKLKFQTQGDIIGAHIHCKVDGGDGPVAATFDVNNLSGSFSLPDNGNGCGLETFEDLYLAMRMGKTYILVHTTEKPEGYLKGDVKGKH